MAGLPKNDGGTTWFQVKLDPPDYTWSSGDCPALLCFVVSYFVGSGDKGTAYKYPMM